MDKETITRMAQEAGAKPGINNEADMEFLERFAALVAAAERKVITDSLQKQADLAQPELTNQCGETCERAKLCATCARALDEQPEQEPVVWQVLNGVCHAGVRSTESLAKDAAAGMQKTHDLGGSLAAFHVRPLYTSPPASKPWVGLTTEDRVEILRARGEASVLHLTEAKLREKNT